MQDYKLVYRLGTSIANADTLSRLQHLEIGPVTGSMVKEATKTYPVMSRVLQYVLQQWPEKSIDVELMPFYRRRHELSCEDGCILWGYKSHCTHSPSLHVDGRIT